MAQLQNDGQPAIELSADDYFSKAFSRNLGLISKEEQEKLKSLRVGVAGLGGLGGIQLLTLVRMGIGAFNIADIDTFSIANTNRQFGALSSTFGKSKIETLKKMALDINPHLEITCFDEGIQAHNADAFVRNADVIVDSIDFFCPAAREQLYNAAQKLNTYVVFAAPIGFSGTCHVFGPGTMSFKEYFDFKDGMTPFEKLVSFAVGLTPRGTHWKYMKFRPESLSDGVAPSIASACDIAAGLLTTEVLSILLNKRPPFAAPYYTQFDPFVGKYRRGRLRWGNRSPLQRLKRWAVARKFKGQIPSINAKVQV